MAPGRHFLDVPLELGRRRDSADGEDEDHDTPMPRLRASVVSDLTGGQEIRERELFPMLAEILDVFLGRLGRGSGFGGGSS